MNQTAGISGAELQSDAPSRGAAFAIVAGALLGNVVSANTVLVSSMGIFIATFNRVYGWSRADISLSWSAFTGVVFVGSTLIGRIADRVEPAFIAAISMLAFGGLLLLVPYMVHDTTSLWIAYLALGAAGLGTSSVVLIKPVVSVFSRRRGLAIGIVLTGVGVGNFVLPRLTSFLVEDGGWKLGYVGLGVCAIAVAPVLWITLGQRGSDRANIVSASLDDDRGRTLREAFASRTFWIISAIALSSGIGMSGPAAHLVPVLTDYALSAKSAANLASLVGLASICGRIATGFMLDKANRPLFGTIVMGVGALGIALLAAFGTPFAMTAALALGFVIGSEIDFLAYVASRYFGLTAHGGIYGWFFGTVALGAAIAPVIMGALRDRQGNYVLGLTLSAGVMGLAAALSATLGPYRYGVLR